MRVVILGTGTAVGKTYVTCRLAEGLRNRRSVLALKPVESGVGPGDWGDAGAIARAAGHPPHGSPWRFAQPVSPHLAARAASSPALEPSKLAAWVGEREREHAASRGEPFVTLVESAGGAFSPLSERATNVDLLRALEPALLLLVAPDSLGVLHDCNVTLRALPRSPDAVVLSSAREADASSGTNAAELRHLGIADVLCVLSPGATSADPVVHWLLTRFEAIPQAVVDIKV